MADNDKTMIFTGGAPVEPEAEEYVCDACGGTCVPDPNRPRFVVCKQCGKVGRLPERCIAPGSVVGKYRILNELAEGGMGSLFLCHPLNDVGTRCVLKVLKKNYGEGKNKASRRFERESSLLFKLQHENVVKIFDYWYDPCGEYIVMEFISGMNLEQMINRGYTIEPDQALQLMQVVANALRFAWVQLKLLHRDIKPSNIMITDEGFVKLLDFGIAKSLSMQDDTNLTITGQGLGSPGFVSLEQLRNTGEVTCTSDIYSLGATIYYILTGRRPYEGNTPMEIFDRMVKEDPVPIQQYNSAVPDLFADLVMRMLSREPSKRPSSWGRLLVEIDRIMRTLYGQL